MNISRVTVQIVLLLDGKMCIFMELDTVQELWTYQGLNVRSWIYFGIQLISKKFFLQMKNIFPIGSRLLNERIIEAW